MLLNSEDNIDICNSLRITDNHSELLKVSDFTMVTILGKDFAQAQVHTINKLWHSLGKVFAQAQVHTINRLWHSLGKDFAQAQVHTINRLWHSCY